MLVLVFCASPRHLMQNYQIWQDNAQWGRIICEGLTAPKIDRGEAACAKLQSGHATQKTRVPIERRL